MIYELRIYHSAEGKFQNLCDRFKNDTFALFEKHGMEVVDFWVDAEEKNRLYYTLAFSSIEDYRQKWKAFGSDPKWQEIVTRTEANGPIVEKIDSYLLEKAPFFK
jgi:hypothetical protein